MKNTDIVQPQAMPSVFAEDVFSASGSADFAIPDATSSSATDTCVMDDGFLPITSEPLDDGGIAPERKNFNGLFYLSTDQRVFLQNGGFITFNANVSSAIGGYPQGAILGNMDSNGMFSFVKSLIDDNTNNFVTTPSYIDGVNWDYVSLKIDLSNVNDAGKILMSEMAMPSDTYEDLTLGASGASYTAPSNGYFVLNKYAGTSGAGISFISDTGLRATFVQVNAAGAAEGFIPVKKGDEVTIDYTTSGATNYFQFIYAVGSESEAS